MEEDSSVGRFFTVANFFTASSVTAVANIIILGSFILLLAVFTSGNIHYNRGVGGGSHFSQNSSWESLIFRQISISWCFMFIAFLLTSFLKTLLSGVVCHTPLPSQPLLVHLFFWSKT